MSTRASGTWTTRAGSSRSKARLTLSPLYPVADAAPDSTGRFTMPHLLGEFTFAVNGLPPGWRVRRVTRGGATLPDHRIIIVGGERVTGIEVVVGGP